MDLASASSLMALSTKESGEKDTLKAKASFTVHLMRSLKVVSRAGNSWMESLRYSSPMASSMKVTWKKTIVSWQELCTTRMVILMRENFSRIREVESVVKLLNSMELNWMDSSSKIKLMVPSSMRTKKVTSSRLKLMHQQLRTSLLWRKASRHKELVLDVTLKM